MYLQLHLMVPIAGLLVAVAGCNGYQMRRGYGVRTNDTNSRLSPEVSSELPEGVERGQVLRVRFPAGTSMESALASYLGIARDRGAHWFSRARMADSAEKPCMQTLMPETMTVEQDVLYHRKQGYLGGATDHTFERVKERVAVPYVRQMDDLGSILEETTIWLSNSRTTCSIALDDGLWVEGLIHGRASIGLLKGPVELDLRVCTGEVVPQIADRPVATLPLGAPDHIAEADKLLPKWIGQRVTLVHGDNLTVGVLKRYARQAVVIETSEGTLVDVHVLDALAIELFSTAPPQDRDSPPMPPPLPTECKKWGQKSELL